MSSSQINFMKRTLSFFLIIASSIAVVSAKSKDPVTKFLLESSDARRMDREEGKLAAERGTTEEIRQYGTLMITDQTMLLAKLEALAEQKKVVLPTTISKKKTKGLHRLEAKHEKDFDKKFISMITIDHKRDVRIFKRATNSKDLQVKAFAVEYLPLIQSHLDKIRKIKAAM